MFIDLHPTNLFNLDDLFDQHKNIVNKFYIVFTLLPS